MMEYYKTKKEHELYQGVRLFRFDYNNPCVTQICLSAGDRF